MQTCWYVVLVVGDCQIEVLLAAVGCWSSVLNCFQELFHGEPHASTFSVIVNIKKVFEFTNSSRSPLTSVLHVSSSFGLTSSVSPSVQ